MKYMGSKAKVARYIVPIIQDYIDRSGFETYLDPFCGGCNIIDKIRAPQRIASDCNKYLIALLQYIQDGGELPGYIEREEYAAVRASRDSYPEWYAGYVGFVCSYNGRFFRRRLLRKDTDDRRAPGLSGRGPAKHRGTAQGSGGGYFSTQRLQSMAAEPLRHLSGSTV